MRQAERRWRRRNGVTSGCLSSIRSMRARRCAKPSRSSLSRDAETFWMSTESEFVALADRVLMSIGAALDVAADSSDADLDWSLNDGILTVDCGAGGKIIVNRHVPNRELWVAAKSGGFHFRDDGGVWRDTRSSDALATVLKRLLQAQSGVEIEFVLPGPA